MDRNRTATPLRTMEPTRFKNPARTKECINPPTDLKDITYFNCGRVGHKSPIYPDPLKVDIKEIVEGEELLSGAELSEEELGKDLP